ncbi:pyridoxal phosphate biosynthetic protein [Pontixanthobacter aestiaquae]|uniref:Pyridoxal phosphate biosynthetic protein n=1 Tax=Pontixanthobacter aestiaquae TaxID=1509367 RepID=A0A844Z896_9SPHN|nr:pyridoxal phosphate biosynthetic protein [Pontixanthobacter aestiaquae]MDN3645843.1 pyridoxal phosphate biosynthetic protein [Pontixanthobacter aestiaquae]MXO83163.1 pyridoxal phosphate biosynthetic protein [Pontixanthobacter aestiaquae]
MSDAPAKLTGEQKRWAISAAAIFVLSIGFLGYALNTRVLVTFAIGWVALQIFGYVGSIKRANGDFSHPLFKSQVMLNVIALSLLIALFLRGTA